MGAWPEMSGFDVVCLQIVMPSRYEPESQRSKQASSPTKHSVESTDVSSAKIKKSRQSRGSTDQQLLKTPSVPVGKGAAGSLAVLTAAAASVGGDSPLPKFEASSADTPLSAPKRKRGRPPASPKPPPSSSPKPPVVCSLVTSFFSCLLCNLSLSTFHLSVHAASCHRTCSSVPLWQVPVGR